MATSGTTAFQMTAREHVVSALEENNIIALGEEPTADEMAACIVRFNGMLKTWQARGVLWKQETIDQAVSVATTALPVDVRGVNAVRFVESANNERQMVRFERDEYKRLPNKAAVGVSTVYYVERGVNALSLNIWPVPASPSTLKLDVDKAMDTITDPGETVDVPEEWAETLYSNLAVRIAGIFGAELSAELVNGARTAERELFDNYRPASYFMGPDYA